MKTIDFKIPAACTIKPCVPRVNGLHVTFPNGWTASIQWGPGMYGSNYNADFSEREYMHATEFEVGCMHPDKSGYGLDGDADPEGYCTLDRVNEILEILSKR